MDVPENTYWGCMPRAAPHSRRVLHQAPFESAASYRSPYTDDRCHHNMGLMTSSFWRLSLQALALPAANTQTRPPAAATGKRSPTARAFVSGARPALDQPAPNTPMRPSATGKVLSALTAFQIQLQQIRQRCQQCARAGTLQKAKVLLALSSRMGRRATGRVKYSPLAGVSAMTQM